MATVNTVSIKTQTTPIRIIIEHIRLTHDCLLDKSNPSVILDVQLPH